VLTSLSRGSCHDFPAGFADTVVMASTDKRKRAVELGRQIRSARKAKNLSQTAIGKAVGDLSRNAVAQWESGKTSPETHNWLKLVSILNGALTQKPPGDEDGAFEVAALPIKGEVRAGAWLEIEDTEQDYGTVPVVPNPRYARAPQYALKVNGTSMNRIAKPGSYVIVASWPELGRELRDGDLLVVRRQRAMTREITVKRAKRGKDGFELWPESDDPRHQAPIPMADGSREVEVTIMGLVIGTYTDIASGGEK
jgi:SOS-response transcriptional repressor LexA